LVTNSSVSSLKAKCDGGSLILRLTQSCFITSSTVSVGSILVRTVTPSAVVTMLVGTSAGFAWPAFAPGPVGLLGVLAELDMGRGSISGTDWLSGLQNDCQQRKVEVNLKKPQTRQHPFQPFAEDKVACKPVGGVRFQSQLILVVVRKALNIVLPLQRRGTD